MKQIHSLFLILVISCSAIAAHSQTTEEEYNYVTKGYKVQIESGLDMKKGYEILDAGWQQTTSGRRAEVKILYRVKDAGKSIAAYMVIYQKGTNAKEYICIPHPSSDEEIKKRYFTQLNDGNSDYSERLQLICYLLTNRLKW